jgi:hypothetical protein
VHDVKATVLGTDKQRFKAEIDFSGRNITAKYLKQCDLNKMLMVDTFCCRLLVIEAHLFVTGS